MSYNLVTLIVFAVALLNVTVSLLCGILLLWKRKEVPDRSRTIFAIPMLLAVAVFANKMLMLTMHPDVNPIMEVLSPFIIFTAPIPQLILLAYPIEVMRPRWMTVRRVLPFLVPWLLLCAPALAVGGVYFTPLYTFHDLIAHLGEWNVWWRLFVVLLIFCYAVLPLILPYSWRDSSASRQWIRAYVATFSTLGVFLLSWMMTQNPVLQVCHNLCSLTLAAVFTWYELVERVTPTSVDLTARYSQPLDGKSEGMASDRPTPQDDLWPRIVKLLHEDDLWRNPNLTLDMLCRLLGSNKDYVSRCFRQHADTTFLDYVNSLRISYVTEELRHHPLQNQRSLFFNVGFRSKTTAYRNFCKYNGQSPSEFIASLQTDSTQ